jgi:5-methylcytosine-specific restriction enzyme subunit McrC
LRIVSPEFGRIDRRHLQSLALARLKTLDQRYVANERPVFDWNDTKSIRVQNYVGVVQVPGLTIEILPKISAPSEAIVDPGIHLRADWVQAQKNLLFMLSIAGLIPFKERDFASLETARMPFFEALVLAFARRLVEELRRGLDRAYVGREDNLHVLRGKILTRIHVRVNAVHPHRLYVAYDDFNANTMLNRLLRGTCQRLLPLTTRNGTQQVLRECLIELSDVQDMEVKKQCFDQVFLRRNNERFAPLLEFCRLVLLGTPPQPGAGGAKTFSLLFPMDKLFEQFVGHLIRRHAEEMGLTHRQVLLQSAGRSQWLVDTPQGQGMFKLKPDLLILNRAGTIQIILDTKWKKLTADIDDASNGVAQSDMYQMFAYAKRFHSNDNILLYPAVEGASAKEYRVVEGNNVQKIRVATLNVSRDLAAERPTVVNELTTVLGLNRLLSQQVASVSNTVFKNQRPISR